MILLELSSKEFVLYKLFIIFAFNHLNDFTIVDKHFSLSIYLEQSWVFPKVIFNVDPFWRKVLIHKSVLKI